MDLIQRTKHQFNESIQTFITAADTLIPIIVEAGQRIATALLNNKKILTCGNGGAACDAMRFAAQMMHRFESERPSLPAIALTADMATLTSIANDTQFQSVYATPIKALGQPDDILLTLSASGQAKNVLDAIEAAHQRQLRVIALTGRDGGEIASLLTQDDVEIRVPSDHTARIQETHCLILNSLCDIIETQLFTTTGL